MFFLEVNENVKIFLLMVLIFFTGFILRAETVHLGDVNGTERAYLIDDQGLPYMYELDSYYNYRITENYLKNGHPGDTLKSGIPWDSYSYYPPGRPAVYPPVISWVSIILYRLLDPFTDMSLYELCFWLPAIVAPFAGTVMFFLIRKYAGAAGGFAGGILMVTAPLYFARTIPGFFDTDMFNCLMPALIVLFYTGVVESRDKYGYITSGILFAVSMLFFSLSWTGWPFMLYVTLASAFIYSIISWRMETPDLSCIKRLFIPVLLAILLIGLFNGPQQLSGINPLSILQSKSSTGSWPDIYESVSELDHPSVEVFFSAAGPLNLGFGVFGALVIISIFIRGDMRRKHLPSFNPFILTISLVWMLAGLTAYYISVRFGILAITPLTFISGIFLGVVFSYMRAISGRWDFRADIPVVLLLALIISVATIEAAEIGRVPFINDDFSDAANFLKDGTKEGTVVVTEWSYGHYITAAAERPVLFDGGSQNTPRAYWIFRAFETDNESLSAGILTMLTSSGDSAVSLLENRTGNTSITVQILNDILGVNRGSAEEILTTKYGLDRDFVNKLLGYTHPERRNYVILTTEGMRYIGYWYLYYGSWNFTSPTPRPLYEVVDTGRSEMLKSVDEGSWRGRRPYRFIIKDENSVKSVEVNESSNFSVILLPDERETIIIDRRFDDSLFVRLVLLGEESEHFRRIYRNGQVTIWGLR
ncbi:STT3 domain-containing protein [Methanothermobacter sp.]|uniref:STT3 domain-containing protein n=1 Tax=Methanothermobacter sp. TaxID=1884223 RepID=UPI002635037D|nr:STT3 domain-containing protein [Methanothermobacter sp.]MDI9618685.1 STT3 domain-containing protein [Methanothermobacter sp.]